MKSAEHSEKTASCPTCGSDKREVKFTSHFSGMPILECPDPWHDCDSAKESAEPSKPAERAPRIDIFKLHQTMTAHLFPAYSNSDERFLALALAGEVGELCNMIKKRWRDGVDLGEEIRDEIADIRVYLELLAHCFDVDGEKLDQCVQKKLQKVVARNAEREHKRA